MTHLTYRLLQDNTCTLPAVLLERYKTADSAALKAALFFVAHKSASLSLLCNELSFSEDTAARVIDFWKNAGLIAEADAQKAYTVETMARSSLVNPEIAILFKEAQRIIGRPTSHSENLALAELYDSDRLSLEFILFVLEFSRGQSKAGSEISTARKTARQWSKAGITTLSDAENHVTELERRERQVSEVAAILGTDPSSLSASNRRTINGWYDKLGYNAAFVSEVLRQRGNASIPYINSVLTAWHQKKYTTIRQTREQIVNAVPTGRKAGGSMFDLAREEAQSRHEQ